MFRRPGCFEPDGLTGRDSRSRRHSCISLHLPGSHLERQIVAFALRPVAEDVRELATEDLAATSIAGIGGPFDGSAVDPDHFDRFDLRSACRLRPTERKRRATA